MREHVGVEEMQDIFGHAQSHRSMFLNPARMSRVCKTKSAGIGTSQTTSLLNRDSSGPLSLERKAFPHDSWSIGELKVTTQSVVFTSPHSEQLLPTSLKLISMFLIIKVPLDHWFPYYK